MDRPRLFRVRIEAEVAALLDLLPNKSAYIRRAILANTARTCPLCDGRGAVVCGVGEHFAAVIAADRPWPESPPARFDVFGANTGTKSDVV